MVIAQETPQKSNNILHTLPSHLLLVPCDLNIVVASDGSWVAISARTQTHKRRRKDPGDPSMGEGEIKSRSSWVTRLAFFFVCVRAAYQTSLSAHVCVFCLLPGGVPLRAITSPLLFSLSACSLLPDPCCPPPFKMHVAVFPAFQARASCERTQNRHPNLPLAALLCPSRFVCALRFGFSYHSYTFTVTLFMFFFLTKVKDLSPWLNEL